VRQEGENQVVVLDDLGEVARSASRSRYGEPGPVNSARDLAILSGEGKARHPRPTASAHTLGTQLAEKGARTQTIMKILGHKSTGMSDDLRQKNISDPVVLADLPVCPAARRGPSPGPLADTLRAGQTRPGTPGTGLKTNFYKTELELGPLPAPAPGRPVRVRTST